MIYWEVFYYPKEKSFAFANDLIKGSESVILISFTNVGAMVSLFVTVLPEFNMAIGIASSRSALSIGFILPLGSALELETFKLR
jgi:hypothetical protein